MAMSSNCLQDLSFAEMPYDPSDHTGLTDVVLDLSLASTSNFNITNFQLDEANANCSTEQR